MPWKLRRLGLEHLESRRLLAAVHIPDDLTGQVGAEVAAPVMIDSAQGVRGADIRIQYDPSLLTLTPEDVTAGSAWGAAEDTEVVVNVDQATGTVTVFISAAAGLPDVDDSLVVFAFGVRDTAEPGAETAVDLIDVTLNEGAIPVDPAPVAGPDPTDGQITVDEEAPGVADRIAGVVYADTDNDEQPGELEGIPGVEVTLVNLQTNGTLQATTDARGAFAFTELAAGNYRIVQTQPAAYLDGGTNELEVELAAGEDLDDQNFRELGLRSQFVYNRLLSMTAQPVGSPQWVEVLEQINADAARAASDDDASASGSGASAAALQSAGAAEGEPDSFSATAGGGLDDGRLAPPLTVAAEGESRPADDAIPQQAVWAPPMTSNHDEEEDGYEAVDRAFAELGLS